MITTYPLNRIEYNAEDAETYLSTRTSGVYGTMDFPVTADGTGRTVTIGPGHAWVKNKEFSGKSIVSNAYEVLEIDAAESERNRVDRIVLRFSRVMNGSELAVLKGTPAVDAVPPDVTQNENVYELGLYTVDVPASSLYVTTQHIENTMQDEEVCGIMVDSVSVVPTKLSQLQNDTGFIDRSVFSVDGAGQCGMGYDNLGQPYVYWSGDVTGSPHTLTFGTGGLPFLSATNTSGGNEALYNPLDYVETYGTDGGWMWRKYKSGRAECWGAHSFSGVNAAKNNNYGVYYSDVQSVAYPFTFKSAPVQITDGGSTNRLNWLRTNASNASMARYWIVGLDANATSVTGTAYIYASGMWK